MSRSLFPDPVVHLLDTSSVVRLDNKDAVLATVPFTAKEQEAIWKGLEQLAKEGRLKVIKQVKSELWRHDRKGRARLMRFANTAIVIKKAREVVKLYQEITTNHRDLMKRGSRRDPADPWLIVASELYGYKIITEELLKADRKPTLPKKRLNMERIPDVCRVRKLHDAIHIRDLALDEKWIK